MTATALNDIIEQWNVNDIRCVNDMAKDISRKLRECVNKVTTKKIITQHSRPWINPDISNQLKKLRRERKRFPLRRSAWNTKRLSELQKETVDMISNAEHELWLSECGKLCSASEREKWKTINTLTNLSNESQVQPIRKVENGNSRITTFAKKNPHFSAGSSNSQISANVEHYNYSSHTTDMLMDAEISDHEVSLTFGKGTDTAGPDDISASMIDKADGDLMHCCLRILWNKACLAGDCSCLERRI